LIYHNNTSSNTEYNSQNYENASYGQQQYTSQNYISMKIEEAERLYTSLIKKRVDKIITYYTFNVSSSLLSLLSPSDEKEQQTHPRQTTEAIQSHMHTEEDRFVPSEINNADQVS